MYAPFAMNKIHFQKPDHAFMEYTKCDTVAGAKFDSGDSGGDGSQQQGGIGLHITSHIGLFAIHASKVSRAL